MERTGANNWYRVVHHDDPVPHLPPPALKFVHMSTEVWYVESGTGDGNFMVCNGSGEDQQCSGGTFGERWLGTTFEQTILDDLNKHDNEEQRKINERINFLRFKNN